MSGVIFDVDLFSYKVNDENSSRLSQEPRADDTTIEVVDDDDDGDGDEDDDDDDNDDDDDDDGDGDEDDDDDDNDEDDDDDDIDRNSSSSDEGNKGNDDVEHTYLFAVVDVSWANGKDDDDGDEDDMSNRSKDNVHPCSIVVDCMLGKGTIAVPSILRFKVSSANTRSDSDGKGGEDNECWRDKDDDDDDGEDDDDNDDTSLVQFVVAVCARIAPVFNDPVRSVHFTSCTLME